MYQISDPINGKQSWTLSPYAIWDNGYKRWIIGNLHEIGQNVAFIYANDDYEGLDDDNNQWNYWDGSNWITAGANDVNITCISNDIFLVECSSKNADDKI